MARSKCSVKPRFGLHEPQVVGALRRAQPRLGLRRADALHAGGCARACRPAGRARARRHRPRDAEGRRRQRLVAASRRLGRTSTAPARADPGRAVERSRPASPARGATRSRSAVRPRTRRALAALAGASEGQQSWSPRTGTPGTVLFHAAIPRRGFGVSTSSVGPPTRRAGERDALELTLVSGRRTLPKRCAKVNATRVRGISGPGTRGLPLRRGGCYDHRPCALPRSTWETRASALAVCDELGLTVRGVGIVRRVGGRRDLDAIARAARARTSRRRLVVGLPLNMDGTEGRQARARAGLRGAPRRAPRRCPSSCGTSASPPSRPSTRSVPPGCRGRDGARWSTRKRRRSSSNPTWLARRDSTSARSIVAARRWRRSRRRGRVVALLLNQRGPAAARSPSP